MIANLTQTAAPQTEPLTLAKVKEHLLIEDDASDGRLSDLLQVAVARFDGPSGILGRSLITQTWALNLCDWPTDELLLPLPPVQAVASVKYYDDANVQQTWAAANYYTTRRGQLTFVRLANSATLPSLYDRPDAIEVSFTAGYGAVPNAIPAPIRQALLLQVGELFGYRGDGEDNETASADAAIERLIAPYRVRTWA